MEQQRCQHYHPRYLQNDGVYSPFRDESGNLVHIEEVSKNLEKRDYNICCETGWNNYRDYYANQQEKRQEPREEEEEEEKDEGYLEEGEIEEPPQPPKCPFPSSYYPLAPYRFKDWLNYCICNCGFWRSANTYEIGIFDSDRIKYLIGRAHLTINRIQKQYGVMISFPQRHAIIVDCCLSDPDDSIHRIKTALREIFLHIESR